MRVSHAVREILRNGRDPDWWRKRLLTHVVGRYFERFGPAGDRVTGRDWDNLLVLDACRYDLFAETASLPGTLSKRRSVDSATPGFLQKTFGEDTHHDIVYVSSNPYTETQLPPDTFHAVDHVWRDGWDDELATVHPDVMAERARAAAERYPDKRLIVHFLQPHYPFVGNVRLDGDTTFGVRDEVVNGETLSADERAPTPFERLRAGDLTHDEVWAAYRSNLEYVLPHVESLLTDLEGRTAVTSDHGNALGERAWPFPVRVYGHPLGIAIPALMEVPWLVQENGDRPDTIAEPPETDRSEPDGDVAARLRDLGYAE